MSAKYDDFLANLAKAYDNFYSEGCWYYEKSSDHIVCKKYSNFLWFFRVANCGSFDILFSVTVEIDEPRTRKNTWEKYTFSLWMNLMLSPNNFFYLLNEIMKSAENRFLLFLQFIVKHGSSTWIFFLHIIQKINSHEQLTCKIANTIIIIYLRHQK